MGFKRIERMIKVTDDWCPNYPNNEVRLRLTLATYNGHCPYIILSAWALMTQALKKSMKPTQKKRKRIFLKSMKKC